MWTISITKNIAGNAKVYFALPLLIILLTVSCKPETDKVEPGFEGFRVPSNFPAPVYKFSGNTITKDGFELGRDLFYDPILSLDNSVSCGSCHKQFSAFADYQHSLSHGIDNQFTKRNSPGIYNLIWQKSFMWDGGINHIEVISIAPITNPLEMNEDLSNVIFKLKNHAKYPKKFAKAFGSDSISSKSLLLALTQFMGMMVSCNSQFDKYQRGEAGGNMSAEELKGLKLFTNKCGSCHAGTLQTDQSFRNNGIVSDLENDPGRYLISGLEEDKGKFKVPSLRNVYITEPYMHDGSIESLEEVLDHYSTKPKYSETIDPLLANEIPMTQEEKRQIIAFLKTLTDYEFTKDEKFKEPL